VKFATYSKDALDFLQIPKGWFFKNSSRGEMKLQNYEYEIDIQSNQKFNHFSFLNLAKRLYLAFDNTEPNYEPIANINLPKTDILVNHIRNQQLKKYCIIVIRLA
jgi:hypothetical protein